MKKVLKNKKAFTLTEMIVVIAIIGILAGVLIPTITSYISRAKESAASQNAMAMYQELYVEVEPTDEVYETLSTQKYYLVQVDKYFVLLENGASNETPIKKNNVTDALGEIDEDVVTTVFVLTEGTNGYTVSKYVYNSNSWSSPEQIYVTPNGNN